MHLLVQSKHLQMDKLHLLRVISLLTVVHKIA